MAFLPYNNSLVIDYRVVTWMRTYIDTILPFEEIKKMIEDKHQGFVMDNSYDFYLMYDTNTETDEYDFIEFRDFNNKDISLDKIDLSHFSSKSFGMFLSLINMPWTLKQERSTDLKRAYKYSLMVSMFLFMKL